MNPMMDGGINIGEAMRRGIEGRNAMLDADRAQQAQEFMRANGAAIMRGDHAVLGQLAGYDPQMALGVQGKRLDMDVARLGMDATRAGMANDRARLDLARQDTNARLEMAREQGRRQAEEFASGADARALSSTKAKLETSLMQGRLALRSPEAWDAFNDGYPDLENVPFEGAEEALAHIEGALGGMGAVPAGFQNLQLRAQAAGLAPGTPAYQAFMAEGDAPKTIVNNNMGTNAYGNERNKNLATQMADIETQAGSARDAVSSLDAMESAMGQDGFYSGAGGQSVLAMKRAAAAMGMDPEGVSSMETFNALAKQAALASMGGSLGTGFSNADRDFVTGQVPGLENTAEGNKSLIDIQRRIAKRRIEKAARARAYEKEHGQIDGGFYDELQAWADANPIFVASPDAGGIDSILDRYR